ncbi:DUF3108 domain-containing protein [Brevundimonas sp.]|uniref:DUF3108 domain-containing protein n=1 Tax=Brevundimonas sp. TaxID=1871086 RepID=UPI003F6F0E72
MIALFGLLAGLAQGPSLDGTRVHEDRACYTISMNRGGVETPMGVTWQTIERTVVDGRPVLRVVVHQRVGGGAFDMRDTFLLDAGTLRPIQLENDRKGERHVTLTYGADAVTGERVEDGAVHEVDVALPGPVWEGNLFGVTFAALPLRAGATFEVPFYQYDKGLGAFNVRVTGEEAVTTPEGPVDAWVLDVTAGGEGPPLTYLIAKTGGRELGYRSARGGQTLGGDCSPLMTASNG